jgi:hypothetical protein
MAIWGASSLLVSALRACGESGARIERPASMRRCRGSHLVWRQGAWVEGGEVDGQRAWVGVGGGVPAGDVAAVDAGADAEVVYLRVSCALGAGKMVRTEVEPLGPRAPKIR